MNIKKFALILIAFALVFAFAGRVKTGAIAGDVVYTSGVANSTSTNTLLGYMPPKSVIASIDVHVQTGFNATTNNLLGVTMIWTGAVDGTNQVRTNIYLTGFNVSTNGGTIGAHVPVTNGYIIPSSNASCAVYGNFAQNGAALATTGRARVIVNYVQY